MALVEGWYEQLRATVLHWGKPGEFSLCKRRIDEDARLRVMFPWYRRKCRACEAKRKRRV